MSSSIPSRVRSTTRLLILFDDLLSLFEAGIVDFGNSFFFFFCEKNVYVGETYRMFETRKKEHEAKVRLTKKDIEDGNIESAEIRMGKEDGGIARHSTQCSKDIDWKKSKVICTEKGFKQRKVREGVESEKLKLKGKTPLNNYEHPEDWKAIILGYTKLEPPTKE